jgi:hypothetical protein
VLRPGEVRLEPGETYQAPEVLFVHSADGVDGISARLHGQVRARPSHPRSPRPLVLNTWEAVYFDHDVERLTHLADTAASIGVERFVIDDGWSGTAGTIRPAWATGTSTRRSGRVACIRSPAMCGHSACSSGCGSSRRWSTSTPTWPARTPTGCST